MMKKLLIINNVPTPYREFMFSKMYEIGREYGIDITVAFQAKEEHGRPWKAEDFFYSFPHYFSNGFWKKKFSYGILNLDILKDIASGAYQWALFSPFMSITNWIAAFLPTQSRKILWSESNLQSTRHIDPVSKFLKSQAIRRFDAIACPGIRAVEYLSFPCPSAETMPRLRLPNIVDTDKFLKKVTAFRPQRSLLRGQLDIPDETICIFAIGRFIEIKNFKPVLKLLKNIEGNYIFCLAGDGPEKANYQALIEENSLQHRVRLLGQIAEDQVIQWLAVADWFFHPARKDPSPLVVIEAMNAGLPMAVSLQTGNCPEAVEDGYNGFVFDANDECQIIETLRKMISLPDIEREKMGLMSAQKAKILFDPISVLKEFYNKILLLE